MLGTFGSAMIIGRVGVLIDKRGSRIVGCWATILLGITLVFFSQLDKFSLHNHIVMFLLAMVGFFALRFLAQGVLSLVSRTMVLKWFVRLRGRITSIVGVFTTLAMSASPVLFNWLISIGGWRHSYLIIGGIIGTVATIMLWLLARNTPEECGLTTDGSAHKIIMGNNVVEERNWTLKEAKRTYTFWIFNLSMAMFSFLSTAFTFHITSIFSQAGLSRHVALTIFFPAACIAVVTKLISGWLCDIEPWRSKLKYQLIIMLAALVLFCIGTLILKSIIGRDLIIAAMGISTGLFVTLSAVCWPQFYGREYLGAIMGINTSYIILFSAIGPLLFAASVQLTHVYTSAILFCLVVIMTLLLLTIKADAP